MKAASGLPRQPCLEARDWGRDASAALTWLFYFHTEQGLSHHLPGSSSLSGGVRSSPPPRTPDSPQLGVSTVKQQVMLPRDALAVHAGSTSLALCSRGELLRFPHVAHSARINASLVSFTLLRQG